MCSADLQRPLAYLIQQGSLLFQAIRCAAQRSWQQRHFGRRGALCSSSFVASPQHLDNRPGQALRYCSEKARREAHPWGHPAAVATKSCNRQKNCPDDAELCTKRGAPLDLYAMTQCECECADGRFVPPRRASGTGGPDRAKTVQKFR